MNKWERLLDSLTHFREGLDIMHELYLREPQVRCLLESHVPLLTSSGFGIVGNALVKLTDQAMKLRDHSASCKVDSHA